MESAVFEPAFIPFAGFERFGVEFVSVLIRVPGGALGVEMGGVQEAFAIALAAIGGDDVGALRRCADLAGAETFFR